MLPSLFWWVMLVWARLNFITVTWENLMGIPRSLVSMGFSHGVFGLKSLFSFETKCFLRFPATVPFNSEVHVCCSQYLMTGRENTSFLIEVWCLTGFQVSVNRGLSSPCLEMWKTRFKPSSSTPFPLFPMAFPSQAPFQFAPSEDRKCRRSSECSSTSLRGCKAATAHLRPALQQVFQDFSIKNL